MSKRQEKIAKNIADQKAFLLERKKMQYMIFKQAHDAGVRIYEGNKEQIPAEEIEKLKVQMAENEELLKKLEAEIVEADPLFKA